MIIFQKEQQTGAIEMSGKIKILIK